MKAYNCSVGIVLAEKVLVADVFYKRLKGLIGRKDFSFGEGLLIIPCKGVHTFWMRFAIDVLYLDSSYNLIHLVESMEPNKKGLMLDLAQSVLELPAGTIKSTGTKVNNLIQFERG